MAADNSKPAVRFAGFTDAWEQRKVGELASDTYGGGTPTTSNDEFWDGTIPWIQSSDLTEHHVFGVAPRKYISKTAVMHSATKIVPENSLAIITRVGVGKLAVMPFSYSTSQDFLSLSKLKTDVVFSAYLLYKKLQSELNSVQGTSIKGITKDELLAKVVSVPERKEQEAIGAYIWHLDHLITLHQRKCDKLIAVKKSMLQKMFPQNGSNVPEIRFAGFTYAWEQRKLGEVATFTKGHGYTKNDLQESGAPIILYGRLYTKYETVISAVDTFVEAKGNSFVSRGNEVIVPASGETAEDISRASVVVKAGVLLGGDLNIIYSNPEISPVFLALSISNGNQQKEMAKRAQGKSVVHLHNADLQEVQLCYPQLEEQKAIGSFFLHLDLLITLHQRKLSKLKMLKKAFLDKMFV